MARSGQRGYGNAGRSAYSGGTAGGQSRAVFKATGGSGARPLNFITALGDSRVSAMYLNGSVSGTNRGALSPLNWANDLGGAGYLIGPGYGVSGERTDQFLARIDAAIATGAGILHLWGGVNNFAQTSAANTYTHAVSGAVIGSAQVAQQAASDIIAMADKAIAAGMKVVAEIEIGANNLDATQTTNARSFNTLLVAAAASRPSLYMHNARSIILVNEAATTTVTKTGYSEDGTHENGRGAYHHGKSMQTLLNTIAPTPYFAAVDRSTIPLPAAGRLQLAPNPVFAVGTGGTLGMGASGTVPGSTTLICGGTTTAVASVTADPSGVGNNVTIAATFGAAGEAVSLYQDVANANWQAGDIVEAVIEVSTNNIASLRNLQPELIVVGTDAGAVQVGPTSHDLSVGASLSGPDETYSITARSRTVLIPTTMTTRQFMQLRLRGTGAAAGAASWVVKSLVINRRAALPY